MFSVWTVAGFVACYLLILFAIAFWGDKRFSGSKQHPAVYSLALGVHCTTWAFFGTTTQAAQYGWAFIPTYLGIILVMLFAFPVLKRVANICHQNRISSLADFIGLQYQKSHLLAALVTVLCFFGVVPYIALQLDAVTRGFGIITRSDDSFGDDIGLYVALIMALFAIVFGTRSISLTDKHPGLMLTVAFQSLVKLFTFLLVGLFICYSVFNGLFDLLGKAQLNDYAKEIIYADSAVGVYLSHVLLGICAMFCLPRQFHINFIENNGDQELNTARWLFPGYLLLMSLFVLPIALAGHLIFSESNVSTDTYLLAIPVFEQNKPVTLLAFLGGLSAATSMVVVATLAVGIMISNNLVTPLWLKLQLAVDRQHGLKPYTLLLIRRLTVFLVLGAAYLYHLDVSQGSPLFKSGIISIALLSQTLPIMLLGMYWSRGTKFAALTALLVGATCWFYWLLWPSIKASYYFGEAPTDLELGQGFIFSLGLNLMCFVLVSLIFPTNKKRLPTPSDTTNPLLHQSVKITSLLALTDKLLNVDKQKTLKTLVEQGESNGYANPQLMEKVENELAGQVGRVSARILLSAVTDKDQVVIPDLVDLVEEASLTFQFNHELLQSSVEHIQQGICVLDQDLSLLAWNKRYLQLFNYPAGMVKIGMSIRTILEYNAQRGMFGNVENAEREIEKRIKYMSQGSKYKYLRTQNNGQVIELNGSPLPGGGFVTTYSDITEYIDIQRQLQDAKSGLETRVNQRTKQLKKANIALASAKRDAELANESKSKFLAAAGHDLMQPFNAASLFASLLVQKAESTELVKLSQNLLDSLNSAEELLSMLLDMTKLEAGKLPTHIQTFPVSQILDPLVAEFSLIAEQKNLRLRYVASDVTVSSDKKLLRRIMQNLISNAIRYTHEGSILVGVKRVGKSINLMVLDTGPGIKEQDQQIVFEEFSQLSSSESKEGLGLGLTIVERISKLLGHDILLRSQVGRGTSFSILIPTGAKVDLPKNTGKDPTPASADLLKGKRVLVVENEVNTLEAVSQLLESWGASVVAAQNLQDALRHADGIDMMLLDYHLDNGETGIDVARAIHKTRTAEIPGILNSANRGEQIRLEAAEAALYYLPKPLKPAAFKRLIRQLWQ